MTSPASGALQHPPVRRRIGAGEIGDVPRPSKSLDDLGQIEGLGTS
jgi:hypothetical protein